ncbi:hypothetical protein DM01DRAFT_1332183 [Hesseltinella vesiculosa]|uniref:CCHC-type domain-containing protein n=1 Tax=Hesseltinella vesiculosa TaxID=101127 RepID=A0A1X2GU92_9FUNG|nr:hypothetical protein DM01DRAFT_1332183 [Hesseltinella vesiculosa]
MTRYTNLGGRKKYVKTDEEFVVTPLLPSKKQVGGGDQAQTSRKRKANDYIAAPSKSKLRKEKSTICFGCREKGHSVENCPKKTSEQGICYNCGSTEHSLKKCKKPRQGNALPFAKCFVCEGQGHLAGQCPKNTKGLYPNGGGCRFCGQVDHLAKNCALTKDDAGTTAVGKIDLDQGADDDDYHIFVNEKTKLDQEIKVEKKQFAVAATTAKLPKKKVVKF